MRWNTLEKLDIMLRITTDSTGQMGTIENEREAIGRWAVSYAGKVKRLKSIS